MSDGWWNRNDRGEQPNSDGPGGVPWLVWMAIAVLLIVAAYVAATGDDAPGPMDPDTPAPTAPSVIMPVNSWS